MAELKPCPFCGGEAELRHDSNELPFSEVQDVFFVICKNCGCYPFKFAGVNLFYTESGKKKAEELKQKAAEAWNRRADNE